MGSMARLGERGKSVASLTCTRWVCFLGIGEEEGLPQKPLECQGWGGSRLPGTGGLTLPALVRCDPGGPWLRTWAAGGTGESHLPAGTGADTGSERGTGRGTRGGRGHGTQPTVPSRSPRWALPRAPGCVPGAVDASGRPGREGAGRESGSWGQRLPRVPSRQERGAARFSETCARPSGGNARRGPRAGRGLGGAGAGGERREFQESYRRGEWQEPAVTLETR